MEPQALIAILQSNYKMAQVFLTPVKTSKRVVQIPLLEKRSVLHNPSSNKPYPQAFKVLNKPQTY